MGYPYFDHFPMLFVLSDRSLVALQVFSLQTAQFYFVSGFSMSTYRKTALV